MTKEQKIYIGRFVPKFLLNLLLGFVVLAICLGVGILVTKFLNPMIFMAIMLIAVFCFTVWLVTYMQLDSEIEEENRLLRNLFSGRKEDYLKFYSKGH